MKLNLPRVHLPPSTAAAAAPVAAASPPVLLIPAVCLSSHGAAEQQAALFQFLAGRLVTEVGRGSGSGVCAQCSICWLSLSWFQSRWQGCTGVRERLQLSPCQAPYHCVPRPRGTQLLVLHTASLVASQLG